MPRSLDTLEAVAGWFHHLEWVGEEFKDSMRMKKDWKFITRLRTHLTSLRALRTVLDGVPCSGALREAFSDLLAEIVTTVEREMEAVVH